MGVSGGVNGEQSYSRSGVVRALLENVPSKDDLGEVGELLCQSRIVGLLPGAQGDDRFVVALLILEQVACVDVGVIAKG